MKPRRGQSRIEREGSHNPHATGPYTHKKPSITKTETSEFFFRMSHSTDSTGQ
jgi:hypothetical protein